MAEGIGKMLGEIFKRGLLAAFDSRIGAAPTDSPEEKMGKLRQKVGGFTKGAVTEGLQTALSDAEVQSKGTDYVRDSLNEAVDGVKNNFGDILGSVKKAVETTDTRDTYLRMKDLLKADEGKWYVQLGKKVVARATAFALPIVAYISGAVASKAVDKPDKAKEYGADFAEIYNNLLSKSTATTT